MEHSMRERLNLFGISEKDFPAIVRLGEAVDPHLDAVLEGFYERAQANPETARFFDSSTQMKTAESAQKRHWQKLLSAQFDEDYVQSCKRIGATHLKIKLPFKHYLSSYAYASSGLQDKLARSYGWSAYFRPHQMATSLNLLNSLFALDTELVIDAYFEEADVDAVQTSFNYMSAAIDKLANGDLNSQLTAQTAPDFPEKYSGLQSAWNNGITSVTQTVMSIDQTVQRIATSTHKLETESSGLASRAESQAASLEETNAALTDLSTSVSETAKNTLEMNKITQNAKDEMSESAVAMTDAGSAMDRIEKASEEIRQIIGLIDDIAFQTNLLALNAGVEAARAGEAGKGFAVVAAEVRNLAGSSSSAANQIKNLIRRSGEEVQNGVTLVENANLALAKVVERFDEVSARASTVAEAATSQSQSLKEASSAVAHMDTITQQNAAMAGDTSMQLKALVATAEKLAAQLGHFKVEDASRSHDRHAA